MAIIVYLCTCTIWPLHNSWNNHWCMHRPSPSLQPLELIASGGCGYGSTLWGANAFREMAPPLSPTSRSQCPQRNDYNLRCQRNCCTPFSEGIASSKVSHFSQTEGIGSSKVEPFLWRYWLLKGGAFSLKALAPARVVEPFLWRYFLLKGGAFSQNAFPPQEWSHFSGDIGSSRLGRVGLAS